MGDEIARVPVLGSSAIFRRQLDGERYTSVGTVDALKVPEERKGWEIWDPPDYFDDGSRWKLFK